MNDATCSITTLSRLRNRAAQVIPNPRMTAALQPFFDRTDSFADLPFSARALILRILGPAAATLWDAQSPQRRRNRARRYDIEHDTRLAGEHRDLWEKRVEIIDWERTGTDIPRERRRAMDIKTQEKELRRLRAEEAALEAALLRKAKHLDLNLPDDWPDDSADPASPETKVPKQPKRRGPLPKYDWSPVRTAVHQKLYDDGVPVAGDGGQAELEQIATSIFPPDRCPTESVIREKVRSLIDEFQRDLWAT